MTADRPWMKFNPKRWRTDEALRMCGPAARGLWMELICIMHEAEPYGHLLVRGKAPHDRMLSVMVGVPANDLPDLLSELEENEVFSRTDDGIIYSRGMVRDEETHQQSSTFGKKGAAAKARKLKAELLASKGGLKGGLKAPPKGTLKLESEEERESDKEPPLVPPSKKDKTTGEHLIPEDWEPREFGAKSQSRAIVDGWSQQERDRQLEAFAAHHRSKRNKFSDWQDAWSTWVLNSVKFERGRDQQVSGKSNDLVEIILEREARKPPS